MLDRLRDIDKDQSIDITPIIECTKNEKWLICLSAIRALEKPNHEVAKQRLRAIVQINDHKKNKDEIVYAVATMGVISKGGFSSASLCNT